MMEECKECDGGARKATLFSFWMQRMVDQLYDSENFFNSQEKSYVQEKWICHQ